jgi:isopropylmalate/homocitrate/citramalate synthase
VKEWVSIPIEVHCHNVWGFGTANTLAAVTAGAEVIHTCINGLGGNAPLEECVMGTEALLGLKTGIKTERFREISAMAKEFSRADWYKPFVGTLSSQTETGIGVSEMWKNRNSDEPGYGRAEPFNYETVGGKAAEVVLGKKSGKASILFKMWELNLPTPPEEQISEMLERVKRYGIQKKRWLKEDEFRKIYTDITGKTI